MFGILNVIFLIPIYLYYPETKGKSLEEIEVLFADLDVQEDAKSIASHIGSTAMYDEKHDAQSRIERGSRLSSRPTSRRFPSNLSTPVVHDKPAHDTDAAEVKYDYMNDTDKNGPNYK